MQDAGRQEGIVKDLLLSGFVTSKIDAFAGVVLVSRKQASSCVHARMQAIWCCLQALACSLVWMHAHVLRTTARHGCDLTDCCATAAFLVCRTQVQASMPSWQVGAKATLRKAPAAPAPKAWAVSADDNDELMDDEELLTEEDKKPAASEWRLPEVLRGPECVGGT